MRRKATFLLQSINSSFSRNQRFFSPRSKYSLLNRKGSREEQVFGISLESLRKQLLQSKSLFEIYDNFIGRADQTDLKPTSSIGEAIFPISTRKTVRYVIHTSPHYNFTDVLKSFEEFLVSEVESRGFTTKEEIDSELRRIYEEEGIYIEFLCHKSPPSLQSEPSIVNAAKVSELSQLSGIDKVVICILSIEDIELDAIRRNALPFAFAALKKVPVHFTLLQDSSKSESEPLLRRSHLALYQEGLLQRLKSFHFDKDSRFSALQLLSHLREQLPFLQQRGFPSTPETVEAEIARMLSASFLASIVKLLRSPWRSLSLAEMESWKVPYLCQLLHLFREFDTEELLLSEAFAKIKAIDASTNPSDQALQILLTLQLTYRCGDFYYLFDSGRRNPEIAKSYFLAFVDGFDRWSTVTTRSLVLPSAARLQPLVDELEELRLRACRSLSNLFREEALAATDPRDRNDKYNAAIVYAQRVVRDPATSTLSVGAQIEQKNLLVSLLIQARRTEEAVVLLEDVVETMESPNKGLVSPKTSREDWEETLLEAKLKLLDLYAASEGSDRSAQRTRIASLVSSFVTPSLLTSPSMSKMLLTRPHYFHLCFLSLLSSQQLARAEVFFQTLLGQIPRLATQPPEAGIESPISAWQSPEQRKLLLKALIDFFESSKGDFPALDPSFESNPALPLFSSQEIVDYCRQRFSALASSSPALQTIMTAKVLLLFATLNYQTRRFDQVVDNCFAASSLCSPPASAPKDEEQRRQQRQLSLLATMASIPLSASLVLTGYRELAMEKGGQYFDFYSRQRDLLTASWYSADFLQQLSVLARERGQDGEAERLLTAAIEKLEGKAREAEAQQGLVSPSLRTNLACLLLDLSRLLRLHPQREGDGQVCLRRAREILEGISAQHPLLATLE